MSYIPIVSKINKLECSPDGGVWMKVAAKSSINTDLLEKSINASVWWGIGGTGGAIIIHKIFVGALQVTRIYVGSQQVLRVYKGSELVQEYN